MLLMFFSALLFSSPLTQAGKLTYTAPQGWQPRPAASSMRVAEFVVPKVQGDPEDAEVVIFFFGGGGGSVEANIERWLGQFQPDADSPKDGNRTTFAMGSLKMTTIDASGTYVAETRPGSGTRLNKPGFRMRAAVVETPGGSYFVKFTGPSATVRQGMPAFEQFLKSLRFS